MGQLIEAKAGVGEPALEIPLSDEQRRVVEVDQHAHRLVLAAPGSGKTRVVAARIRYLIEHLGVDPQAILAMTFSRQASAELDHRLGQTGVWTGTFHAVCADILADHGAAVGIPLPLRIADGADQREMLFIAAARAGVPLPVEEREREKFRRELAEGVRRRKQLGWNGSARRGDRPVLPEELVEAVAHAYQSLLEEHGALDFDDLIGRAVQTLLGDTSGTLSAWNVGPGTDADMSAQGTIVGEVARHYRRRLRFVLLDEFHDISPDQFELVRLLVPARGGNGELFAVADPDQAIYGWRGADATATLVRFRREYRPVEYRLTHNFRCEPAVWEAAKSVMGEARTSRVAGVARTRERPEPVIAYAYQDEAAEAAGLTRLIRHAVDSGQRVFGDIAILYRSHARANTVEAALVDAEIPIWRVQDDRFFAQAEVREMLRYLDLALALRDDTFCGALNWPRVLVDELTMGDLRRQALAAGVPVCELARRVAVDPALATPLTRAAVRDFLGLVDSVLVSAGDEPAGAVCNRMLALLDGRRCPLPASEKDNLLGVGDLLGRLLGDAVERLVTAIAADRLVVLLHDGGADASAAAVLLWHVLSNYLEHPAILREVGDTIPAGSFVVSLGVPTTTNDGIALAVLRLRAYAYPVVTQAWRLGQLLLTSFEHLDQGRFVLFDLETGSVHPSRAEIVEVAALAFEAGIQAGPVRACRVRPSGPKAIEAGATSVNQLAWADVATAEPPSAVLPRLLAFLGEATLVGHNIEMFDYPILRRAVAAVGLPLPHHLLIDTLPMARRLLPGLRSYKLADLAAYLGVAVSKAHQAGADVRTNAAVFARLLVELRRRRALDALSETLPLVAAGTLAAGVPLDAENATLVLAGRRALDGAASRRVVDAWLTAAPSASAAISMLERRSPHSPADDDRWHQLRSGWADALAAFDQAVPNGSLRAFLRYAALSEPGDHVPVVAEGLPPDDPRRSPAAERVTMMTIHAAKGKEWPVVFLLGAEEGQIPWYRAVTPEEIEEERRVLYVGMTRAEHRLFLTRICHSYGRTRQESPFLRQVPDHLLERRRPPI